jgi:CDP-diglyceride synthetase
MEKWGIGGGIFLVVAGIVCIKAGQGPGGIAAIIVGLVVIVGTVGDFFVSIFGRLFGG